MNTHALITSLVILWIATSISNFPITDAQSQSSALESLESLISAERSFAATSVASGTRAAFLANLAENGIVFAPAPTNGKQLWSQRPPSKSVLAWEPEFSAIASSGDMGYNYGPWTWSAHKDTLPSGFGHFTSVWKKQTDGSWKVAIDMGIAYATPFPKPSGVATTVHTTTMTTKKSNSPSSHSQSLLAAEKQFAELSYNKDVVLAYQTFADDSIALFRSDKHPMHGKNNISETLFEKNAPTTWEILGSDVSSAGDMGYTYGAYSFVVGSAAKQAGQQKAGHYERVWKRTQNHHNHPAEWKLVLDVTNPLPQ